MTSLAGQTYAFLMTILAGAIVGLLFDVYWVFRSTFRPRQFATALTDLLYWIVVTPTVFAMLLAGNWGELRFYVLIGLGVGLLLYFQALSSIVIWCLTGLIRGIGRLFGSLAFGVIRAISLPFLLLRNAFGGLAANRRRGGFGRPSMSWAVRPKIRMAWQRFSWARFFHRGS